MKIKKLLLAAGTFLLAAFTIAYAALPTVAHAQEVQTGAKIILDSYTVSSNPVKPGETVKITLNLENVGNYDAYGVLLSQSIGNSMVIPPYGEGNQVYLDTIAAGSKKECTINGLVLPSVTGDNALDYFGVTFKDKVTGDTSNSFMISLDVVNDGKLKLTGSSLPSSAEAGASFTNMLEIFNYGSTAVFDMKLYSEAADGTSALAGNLGNLGAGQRINYDYQASFGQPGKHRLTVWLTYTDGKGEQWQTDKLSTEVDVIESKQTVPKTATPEVTGSQNGLPELDASILWLIIAASVFLLALIIFLVLRKRKKYIE